MTWPEAFATSVGLLAAAWAMRGMFAALLAPNTIRDDDDGADS